MTDAPDPENLVESDQPTIPAPKKERTMLDSIKAYKELAVGIGAMIAALAGLIRPTDTTATESSFQWTQKELERVSADNKQTHADLVALHQYLVSYVKSQKKFQTFQLEQLIEDEAPPPPKRIPHRTAHGSIIAEPVLEEPEIPVPLQEAQQIMQELPELPTLKSQPHVFKKESFDAVTDIEPQD